MDFPYVALYRTRVDFFIIVGQAPSEHDICCRLSVTDRLVCIVRFVPSFNSISASVKLIERKGPQKA